MWLEDEEKEEEKGFAQQNLLKIQDLCSSINMLN